MYFISIIGLISLLIPRRFEGIIEHFKVPEDASELYTFYKNMKMKNVTILFLLLSVNIILTKIKI